MSPLARRRRVTGPPVGRVYETLVAPTRRGSVVDGFRRTGGFDADLA